MNAREIINRLAQITIDDEWDVSLDHGEKLQFLCAAAKALPVDWDVRHVVVAVEGGVASVEAVDGPTEAYIVDYDGLDCFDSSEIIRVADRGTRIDFTPYSQAEGMSFLEAVTVAWDKWAMTAGEDVPEFQHGTHGELVDFDYSHNPQATDLDTDDDPTPFQGERVS